MLTPAQLSAIDRHLRKENWLLNEALIAELTDHYVAGIEDQLAQGLPFEVAIKTIHTGFGGRKGLLKMEEEFQTQNALKIDHYIWREVRAFFELSRIGILLALLVLMYWLNAYSPIKEDVEAFFSTGLFIMSASIFGPVLVAILLFARKKPVDRGILSPTTLGFYALYLMGLAQQLTAKYFTQNITPATVASYKLWGNTLTETLVLIYMIASVMGIRRFFLSQPKLA